MRLSIAARIEQNFLWRLFWSVLDWPSTAFAIPLAKLRHQPQYYSPLSDHLDVVSCFLMKFCFRITANFEKPALRPDGGGFESSECLYIWGIPSLGTIFFSIIHSCQLCLLCLF